MATRKLAHWAVSLNSVPSTVRTAAIRSLYNYIGCAIGGSNHPTVAKAHSALHPFFGSATSTLLGRQSSPRTDSQHAALLNGIASHVHDYDDTHLATIIHPTGPVASAILAWAEYNGNVSGDSLLLALVAGIEASCKVGLAVWPEHYDIGWHITSSTGSIGAAVGIGKLMGLSEDQMAHAIGIAAVQVIGLREMFGSDTKSFHPGRAAASGLLAAQLARSGFTSSEKALEAKRGWANVVAGGGTPQLDKLIASLGKEWEIETNAFKPFPCGIVCHPAIDAAIQCRESLLSKGLNPAKDIVKVKAKVHPLVIELTSKRKPKDGLESKFSVFHGCAVGLLYGKAGPAEYDDAVVIRPEVTSLRDKVDAQMDQSLAADEVYMSIQLSDGTHLEKHVAHAVGSLAVPMSDQQLTDKFVDQAALVLGEQHAKEASDAAWRVCKEKDVAAAVGCFSSPVGNS